MGDGGREGMRQEAGRLRGSRIGRGERGSTVVSISETKFSFPFGSSKLKRGGKCGVRKGKVRVARVLGRVCECVDKTRRSRVDSSLSKGHNWGTFTSLPLPPSFKRWIETEAEVTSSSSLRPVRRCCTPLIACWMDRRK